MKVLVAAVILATIHCSAVSSCQFYPAGEYLRFVRVPENLTIGGEVLKIEVHPRKNLSIRPVDKAEDVNYFAYQELNKTTVSVLLAKSLEKLVDRENPQNVLKFRLGCDYSDGHDTVTSYLSVTVYVEDVNDHAPIFVDAPYQVSIDEQTPVGVTIFRGILAIDNDKPNTPNSDVHYSISSGNERGRFALDSSHRPLLQIKKPLDYDMGDREFLLTITASDRGVPPQVTNTTLKVKVIDNDDLPPKFTKGVYRTRITEFYPITGTKLHQKLKFEPVIFAFDQDVSIDAPIRYDIIAGNDRRLFSLDSTNGSLYLEREVDLDQERTLPGNTFVLQIQASQVDNPLKTGVARVEVEVMDLNDNLPEFEVDFYNISIVENLPNGFSVLQVVAKDQDQGDNAEFTYLLDDDSGAFALDARTGWLTVRDQSVLDRERQTAIKMKVIAKEKMPSVVARKDGISSVMIEVLLLDANDNNPTFIPNNLYEFMVSPDAQVGDVVGTVHAVDPDLGRNGMVLYDIQRTKNGSRSLPFVVEPKTGRVKVNEAPLSQGRHALFIEASDQPANPSERRYSLAVVTVEVLKPGSKGANDEVPDFVGAPYEFWVGGNAGIGMSVGQVRVTDAVDKSTIGYDLLHSYTEGVPFAIEERSGVITVVDELSKFDRALYDFEAVVTNEEDVTLVTNLTVHVVDPQDERRILMKGTGSSPIEFRVKENKAGAVIGQLMYKNATTKSLSFIIANQQDVTDLIAISHEGTLYTLKKLDREQRDVYRLTIIAQYNRGVISGAGIYQVTVYVEDENDNPPIFEHPLYEGTIKENCIAGTQVDLNYPVKAIDYDSETNAQFSFSLFGEGSEMFRVDKNTGKVIFISADSPLDREDIDQYNLRIVATDKGGLSSQAKLCINVQDENDNSPVFLQMVLLPDNDVKILEFDRVKSDTSLVDKVNSTKEMAINALRKKGNLNTIAPLLAISEDIRVGTAVLKLIAEDKDAGNNGLIKYEMVSETYIPSVVLSGPLRVTQYFMVNPTNGEVSVARSLPAESEFHLNISATDQGGLKDNVTIRIYVRDNNDHAPVFKKSFYNFDAEEGKYANKIIGRVEASDADFGENANISYAIVGKGIPFRISEFGGDIVVQGELDRETMDKYTFKVLARDNARANIMSSAVDIEVNVLDVNDNSPEFYGYDDTVIENGEELPVYYARVAENSPIGTPISRVFANDSDFSGNGNGLLLFDIPQQKNRESLFVVDSKDGIIITIGKLDYEKQKIHNVTIIASDLGSPSLSSTAILLVSVIDVPEDQIYKEKSVFAHRYFEIEVEENIPVPVKLLGLNVTESYNSHKFRFTLIPGSDKEILRMFKVDPKNGTVYLTLSPDRERRDKYEFKIRADKVKLGRGLPVMVYPVTSDRLTDLAFNEVKVVVKIKDMNDNIPKFTVNGRPIVTAIPSSANFGYEILRLHAKDADLGINGEIRYQILGRVADESHRFAIDPVSGQVRALTSFTRDASKVFGFDVKATDRRGADDGKSSIANVFVYVIDERKQLVMVMGSKPTDVEKNMKNITSALQNITGFDVRVRKLEPHWDQNLIDYSATDMYLYAVDPLLNIIIDMEHLRKVLHTKQLELQQMLEPHKVLDIANGIAPNVQTRSQRFLLSTLEVGVVVLGCVVFVGALATALCVTCVRKNRRARQKTYPKPPPLGFTLEPHGKPIFPQAYGEPYTEPTDSYLSVLASSRANRRRHQHERGCVRFANRKASATGLQTSATSLHSSGKDSGIVDSAGELVGRCQCGHSSSASEDSSNSSYEDSLKSVPHRKTKETSYRNMANLRNSRNFQQRLSNRSFSEERIHETPMVHHIPMHRSSVQLAPHVLANHPGVHRRSTDRLVLACSPNLNA